MLAATRMTMADACRLHVHIRPLENFDSNCVTLVYSKTVIKPAVDMFVVHGKCGGQCRDETLSAEFIKSVQV